MLEEVLNWLFGVDNMKALAASVKRARAEREKPILAMKARIKELAKILERYYGAFESGAVDTQELSERTGPHKLEKRQLEAELEQRAMMERLPAGITNPAKVAEIREELRTLFNAATLQAKKRLLSILLEKVVVSGKDITLHGKTSGIIAVFDVGKVSGEDDVTRLIDSNTKWQPVGDSNPCDKTENLAS